MTAVLQLGEGCKAHLSISWCRIGIVAAILWLGLGVATIAATIAASSRVLGGAVAAAPIAGPATCRVCA